MASRAQNLGKLGKIILEGGTLGLTAASIAITDSSYVPVTDMAVRPAGGYVKITGTGFVSGCTLYINGTPATSTTFISATEVRAQLPALAIGTYSLMLFNSATVAAIWASGIVYSSAPVWGTTAYTNAGNIISTQLLATGDSTLVYTLASGTLPAGVTLSSTGLLSGTAAGITDTTTVTFTISVIDAQSQATPQLISLSLTFWIGKLFTWGDNSVGQLGLNTNSSVNSPNQIGTLTNWKTISISSYTGNLTSAIKTDGTLWLTGSNAYGQLGDGTTIGKSSLTQIGTLTNWKLASAGFHHTLAIKTNGTLWAWGHNNFNQLGDGTITNRLSPIQIGSLTNWLSISAGFYHTSAIKTDGTLWAWGFNFGGQLGDSTRGNKNSPVQIGTLTNWITVSAGTYNTIAIKTDGTLWAWGKNEKGQLGISLAPAAGYTLSPTQIGALTTWKTAAIGNVFAIATRTDNTLWAWGSNSYGQLGDGTKVDKSSPQQVGILTNWSNISAGAQHVIATKTDGTLWSWGRGDYGGSLGQSLSGASANKSSPNQVGSLTTWLVVAAGGYTSSAISS